MPGMLIRPTRVAAMSCQALSPASSQLGYGITAPSTPLVGAAVRRTAGLHGRILPELLPVGSGGMSAEQNLAHGRLQGRPTLCIRKLTSPYTEHDHPGNGPFPAK